MTDDPETAESLLLLRPSSYPVAPSRPATARKPAPLPIAPQEADEWPEEEETALDASEDVKAAVAGRWSRLMRPRKKSKGGGS